MKSKLTIILALLSTILVICTSIADLQLLRYAKQHDVITQMNTAGSSGNVEAVCRTFQLPWLARQYDVLTPLAFGVLVLLAGGLVWGKKLTLRQSEQRISLFILIIGMTVMISSQFIDPFYPFSLCRGLLT